MYSFSEDTVITGALSARYGRSRATSPGGHPGIRTSRTTRPADEPGFWPHHAALAWRQVFDRRLRPLNLTRPSSFC